MLLLCLVVASMPAPCATYTRAYVHTVHTHMLLLCLVPPCRPRAPAVTVAGIHSPDAPRLAAALLPSGCELSYHLALAALLPYVPT